MRKKILKSILILALSLSFSPCSQGFQTYPLQVHQGITKLGINRVEYIAEDVPLKFSSDALKEIIQANVDVDTDSILESVSLFPSGTSHLHFDDENLQKGLVYIQTATQDVIDLLISSPWDNAVLARSILGTFLHPIQDFYSHSTWIDMGRVRLVNFYDVRNTSEFLATPTSIGNVCVADDAGRLLGAINLSTGYYSDPHPSGLDKCDHGTPFLCNTEGINADIPCRGAKFVVAGTSAVLETSTYVQSIVDELGGRGRFDSICALMGIEEDKCPIPFRVTKSEYPSEIFNTVVDGTTVFDVQTYWEGSPEFPVTLYTAFDSDCRSVDCSIGESEVYETKQTPFSWTAACVGHISFFNLVFGNGKPTPGVTETLTSYVFLVDANGDTSINSGLIQLECTYTP